MSKTANVQKFPMPIGSWCVIRHREIEGVYELYQVLTNRMIAHSTGLESLVEWFSISGAAYDREDLA